MALQFLYWRASQWQAGGAGMHLQLCCIKLRPSQLFTQRLPRPVKLLKAPNHPLWYCSCPERAVAGLGNPSLCHDCSSQ